MQLPPCGVYRTAREVGSIPAGRLVYFHNHGDPGPGLYLPERWQHNRAQFASRGHVLQDLDNLEALQPLPAEGFYRVTEPFHCCEKRCREFGQDALVQLGYNAEAEPILFTPELVDAMLAIPAKGWKTSLSIMARLQRLHVPESNRGSAADQ